MSVELNPVELGFRRPFTKEVTQTLSLRNPNSEPVAFKVKTTAPKQYCVRPNSGRIEPGEVLDVLVLLQAMKEDPPLDAKCRDKFLVQSVAVQPNQEFTNVAAVWSNIEQTAKSSILEKKIRVTFLPEDGSAVTPSRPTTNHVEDQPPAYSSPYSTANTPAQQPSAMAGDSSQRSTENKENGATKGQTNDSTYLGAAAAGVAGAAVGVAGAAGAAAAAVPKTSDDLNAQLKAAQAQIASLKEQVSAGIRQRKAAAAASTTSGSTTMAMQQPTTTGGVPVQIVAGLCLLTFLLGYFFF